MVTAEPQLRALQANGLYDRERMGFGTFLSADEILARVGAGRRVSDAVQGIRGIAVRGTGSTGIWFRGKRFGGSCQMPAYIDGIWLPASQINQLKPENVTAIEVYHGSETPPRFIPVGNPTGVGGSVCGAVVVWTNGRG